MVLRNWSYTVAQKTPGSSTRTLNPVFKRKHYFFGRAVLSSSQHLSAKVKAYGVFLSVCFWL